MEGVYAERIQAKASNVTFLHLEERETFPNNARCPLIIYQQAVPKNDDAIEKVFSFCIIYLIW